ncbi:hypothetical protein CC79DRAFT_757411 [Sarocladium strictum]
MGRIRTMLSEEGEDVKVKEKRNCIGEAVQIRANHENIHFAISARSQSVTAPFASLAGNSFRRLIVKASSFSLRVPSTPPSSADRPWEHLAPIIWLHEEFGPSSEERRSLDSRRCGWRYAWLVLIDRARDPGWCTTRQCGFASAHHLRHRLGR